MDDELPGIRRLCVAYGVESPGGCGGDGKIAAERRGATVFIGACASLGLDRILLDRHNAGQVGVLPVGIDEPRVVSSLVEGLVRATAALNVRLRLAFHEGVTTLVRGSFGGKAVAKVRRLAEGPSLRAALAEHPQASLAVMLSAPVFEGVGLRMPTDQFHRVAIADPDPDSCCIAWIFVPACPLSESACPLVTGSDNGWSSKGRREMLPLTSRQVSLRKEVRSMSDDPFAPPASA
jgi:hypothetical protein